MIDFRFTVDIEGVERSFHALADALEHVKKPLVRTGGYIRSRARKRFSQEGPGWEPLAESTKKRKYNAEMVQLLADGGRGKLGERSIVQRAVRDVAGAEKWTAKGDLARQAADEARAAGRKFKTLDNKAARAYRQAKIRLGKLDAYGDIAEAAGVGRQNLVSFARREVERAHRHGRVLRAIAALQRAGYVLSKQEKRAMARKGKRRYMASPETTKVLGSLSNTLSLVVKDGRLKVFSKAYISGIHNDGGVAGNGARIPARTFLELEPEDLTFFVKVLREQAIEAWEGA